MQERHGSWDSLFRSIDEVGKKLSGFVKNTTPDREVS